MLRTTKTAALLAYLALEGKQPQARVHLASLLWDGYEPTTARSSLRVALTYLRQALLPLQPLTIFHKRVQWQSLEDTIWSDALAFEEIALRPEAEDTPQRIEAALALYKGEFLTGWENVDSAPFQEWVLKRRAHYQTLFTTLQQRLIKSIPATPQKAVESPNRPNNLRRALTPLIGRAEMVKQLQQTLLDPHYPLVVLVGEGGIGKTRLALATAWALLNTPNATDATNQTGAFAHGFWFVSLNEIMPQAIISNDELVEHIAGAISVAIALHFAESKTRAQQLVSWLHEKSLLLILDGVEHLSGIETFIDQVLETAPGVKLLVTSQRRLNLQAARTFSVQELATPASAIISTAASEELQTYPSIQLFVERVQRIQMNFQLDAQNSTAIAQICRLVGGMPLAIELAAAMMTIYSASKLAEQLTLGVINLPMTWPDLSPQHHSMTQVLAASWQRLTSMEARLLSQCTVLLGSFSLAALLVISETTPSIVRALVEKSLLRMTEGESNRFTMHGLIRQYANHQFTQQPDFVTYTRDRHAVYYLTLLQSQEDALPNQEAAQQVIYTELDNIRAAWQWAIESRNLSLLESSYEALARFYRVRNLGLEGFTVFAQASNAIHSPFMLDQAAGQRAARLRAMLLLYIGEFGNSARPPESTDAITEAHALGEQLGNKLVVALAAREQARLALFSSNFAGM